MNVGIILEASGTYNIWMVCLESPDALNHLMLLFLLGVGCGVEQGTIALT